MALVPGKEVEIAGTKYTLPPVNIALRRLHKDFLARAVKFSDGGIVPSNDDILEMSQIVAGAMKRNYPELDFGTLEQYLDDEKLLECFIAVMAAGRAGPQLGETKPGSP